MLIHHQVKPPDTPMGYSATKEHVMSKRENVKSKLHTEALAYAARGIPVFPCWPNTEKPITKHGFLDATTDLNQIDAWWLAHPDANIAFSPASIGQGVIDLDGEAGKTAWFILGLTLDTPDTFTVSTPRGGLHLCYIAENFPTTGYAPGRKRCVGEHIDTRGEGGYVLLPPSVTEHGTYEVIDDREPVPMPEWIIDKLKPVERPQGETDGELDMPYTISRMTQLLQARVKVAKNLPDDEAARYVSVEGEGGDNYLLQVCYELRDAGTSQGKIPEMLKESGWNAACRPPWSDGELQTKAERAYKYPQNKQPGTKRPKSLEENFPHLVKLGGSASKPSYEDDFGGLTFLTMKQCASLPPRKYVIKGMLAETNVGCIFGTPGAGK